MQEDNFVPIAARNINRDTNSVKSAGTGWNRIKILYRNGGNEMDGLFVLVKDNVRILLPVGIFLLIIAGIMVLKKVVFQKQKKKELSQAAEDRMREENLNHVILNRHAEGQKWKEAYKPYEVDYSNAGGGKGNMEQIQGKRYPVMLQLVERTELSTRKFMMNPEKAIRVGSGMEGNDISVLAEGVSTHQFEIFTIRDKVFIRNLGSGNRTVVKRKKGQVIVDEKGIRLLSGDRILLGTVSYDITIQENIVRD